MEWELPYRSPLLGMKCALWFYSVLLCIVGAKGETSHGHATLSVSVPHMYYICPEGATVKLVCSQKGAGMYPRDELKNSWLFTAHSDQHCHNRVGPRNGSVVDRPGANHSLPRGVHFGHGDHNFWVTLQNVTMLDQGRYCCMVLELHRPGAGVDHKHIQILQRPHSHVVLHVTPRRNGSQECTVWDSKAPEGTVPVVLATVACIMALLSLPIILVLVYKQRQNSQSSRRAHELVRMDSEAQGHENPVFLGGSPQTKTRTVSQIMTRQASETGRHLLSEPGTPLSPPAHGDVFFAIQDPIPESPDFLQL